MFRCNLLATTCSVFKGNSTTHPTQVCGFTVCGTSALSISLCGCTGNIMIYLYDSIGNLLYANSYECLTCSALVYYPASYYSGDANQCAAYTMSQGCFFNSGACSGAAVVSVTTSHIISNVFNGGSIIKDEKVMNLMAEDSNIAPLIQEVKSGRGDRDEGIDGNNYAQSAIQEEKGEYREHEPVIAKEFMNEMEDNQNTNQSPKDIPDDLVSE